MTRFPRPFGLALILLAAAAAACGDGIVHPHAVSGYYRLVSVNGQALPYLSPPSFGGVFWHVCRGDLVLRPGGSFMHGVGSNQGAVFTGDGTYRLSDRQVVLRWRGVTEESDVMGRLSGDSIVFAYTDWAGRPLQFTFRRAQPGSSSLRSNRYWLTSINGRTDDPLVAYDTTVGDVHYVAHVAFDSVIFSDGVFFRRHRSQSSSASVGGQQTSSGSDEWTMSGAYESGPGWILLLHYFPPSVTVRGRDSLSMAGDTLTRRTSLITGLIWERYTSR